METGFQLTYRIAPFYHLPAWLSHSRYNCRQHLGVVDNQRPAFSVHGDHGNADMTTYLGYLKRAEGKVSTQIPPAVESQQYDNDAEQLEARCSGELQYNSEFSVRS